MSRLIDADVLLAWINETQWHTSKMNAVRAKINTMPTTDAVSVVRCKDCRFSEVHKNHNSGVMTRYCKAFTQVRMMTDDDYCSYGKERP